MALARTSRSTFSRGVHPRDYKAATADKTSEPMPFVREYVLPLSQNIGSASVPIVKAGDRVQRGQQIAVPGGFVSVSLHAPVTGTVTAIEPRPRAGGAMDPSIVLQTDPFSSQRLPTSQPIDIDAWDRDTLLKAIQHAGIVGLGGAAFPLHVKLSPPPDKHFDTVIINGCECEPYLTCDHRIMVERSAALINSTKLLMRLTGANRAIIGIETNKPDAIEALRSIARAPIEVLPLHVKYPQGAERMLIAAAMGPEVPAGKLPVDFGFLVSNAGSAVALGDLIETGKPLIDRMVTVTGPAVAEPKNLLVPIGTSVSAMLDHCGGLLPSARQVVLGGPMMGMSLSRLDVPLVKGASGVLCLDELAPAAGEAGPCIRCSRCVEACPMSLNPSRLVRLARAGRPEDLERSHIASCFECASCSFVCPSGIPLVHWLRIGKALTADRKSKQ